MSAGGAPGAAGAPGAPGAPAEPLTGILLVGGASSRFGSPKALAQLGRDGEGGRDGDGPGGAAGAGETLAERGRRTLAAACDEVLVVGKAADRLPLPFPLVEDAGPLRAPIVGVIAGLRAARHDLCVILPVDCPLVDAALLLRLAAACAGSAGARPPSGPLPGAYRRSAVLPALERALAAGELSLWRALEGLPVAVVAVDEEQLADADVPADLERLRAARPRGAAEPPRAMEPSRTAEPPRR